MFFVSDFQDGELARQADQRDAKKDGGSGPEHKTLEGRHRETEGQQEGRKRHQRQVRIGRSRRENEKLCNSGL